MWISALITNSHQLIESFWKCSSRRKQKQSLVENYCCQTPHTQGKSSAIWKVVVWVWWGQNCFVVLNVEGWRREIKWFNLCPAKCRVMHALEEILIDWSEKDFLHFVAQTKLVLDSREAIAIDNRNDGIEKHTLPSHDGPNAAPNRNSIWRQTDFFKRLAKCRLHAWFTAFHFTAGERNNAWK